MILSDISVKRPVAALVLSLLLCVFGFISFSKLAVRELPDVESPVVSITTRYDGAAATIIENQITSVLEDQLSGISGIDEITSMTRNGVSRIIITFDLGYNLDTGISDVRDAIARAQRALPDGADDPIVYKNNGSGKSSLYITLSSTSMDRTALTDYANRILLDRFSLLSGVSSIELSGGLYQVMYIELNASLMAGRNITTIDIINALRAENLESPGGEIRNDVSTMAVRTARNYHNSKDFQQLVIKVVDSQPIYLQDVAKVFIGAENESSTFKNNGVVNISLGITTQSDANPLEVANLVRDEVNKLQKFLPDNTKLEIDYDATLFIERSVQEVYSTLFVTCALVVLILYIFIGQAKATLIPAVTVPVSLISAFIAAYYLGFSINLITLLALILSIGLVVDDAIVVIENIFHHLKQGSSPLVAAYNGAREVGFAVVATTLVLVMIFMPLAFMDGMAGLMLTEFAVLISMAVIFSSLIALTLTPMLGSKLLKVNVKNSRFNQLINRFFARLENIYRRLLQASLKVRYLGPLIIIACIGGIYLLVKNIPAQLEPSVDRGVLFAFVRGDNATSYNRMSTNMDIVESRLMPLLGKGFLKSFSIQTPAFGGNAGDETGFVTMILDDWNDRAISSNQALAQVRQTLSGIADVKISVFPPSFGGKSDDPVRFILGGTSYQELLAMAEKLVDLAKPYGIMEDIDIEYSEDTPEILININKEYAAQLGISVADIAQTLEVMLGGRRETTFTDRGEEYDVYLRGSENQFNSSADLSKIYLRSSKGELVTLDLLATIEEVAAAARLEHYNKQKAVTIEASLADGHTLGEALDLLDRLAIENLPNDISVNYSGESKNFKENQSSMLIVFGLALLIAYLVLAAQFESFINPMVVMFTVPMGIFGGLLGLLLMDQNMNIYSQIGMIMLIGMVTKNGILIVEFANQMRDRGLEFNDALLDACMRRLRPILMTAATTLIGALPLMYSNGAGYESRVAIGTVVFFGMACATIITLFVIPMMYSLLSRNTKSPEFVTNQLEQELKLEDIKHS